MIDTYLHRRKFYQIRKASPSQAFISYSPGSDAAPTGELDRRNTDAGGGTSMGKIFISYRRADAEFAAGELGRQLRRDFGDEQVFRDKEDVGGGVAWRQEVLHEIDRDSVLLVLIGEDWANAKDADGRRRLDNSDDPLRLEITDGIREGARILPILLENAQMPSEEELPPELRLLAGINALNLRDGDWEYYFDKIRKTLETVGFKPVDSLSQAPPQERQTTLPTPKKSVFGLIMGTIGAVLVVLVLLAVALGNLDRAGHIAAAVFSIGGLVLGVIAWRELRHGRSRVRFLGIVVCILAALGFFVALAGMGSRTAPPKRASEQTAKPPSSATLEPTTGVTSVPLLKDHAVIRYDPTLWQVDTTVPKQPGMFQLIHKSGEVWVKVTSERLPIGVEKLVEHSLAEIKKADPMAKVTRQGSRSVNGRNMAFREIEATIFDIPATYYIHYYSDTSGYIQFIGWTYRSLLKEYRSTIEEFLEGFEVADLTPGPPSPETNVSPPPTSSAPKP